MQPLQGADQAWDAPGASGRSAQSPAIRAATHPHPRIWITPRHLGSGRCRARVFCTLLLVAEARTGSRRDVPGPNWVRLIGVFVLGVVIVATGGCGGSSGSSGSFPGGTYARTVRSAGVTTKGPKPHRLRGGYWRITIQGDRGWITAPTNKRLLTFSVSASGNVSGNVGSAGNLTVGPAPRCIDQKRPTKGSYGFTFYGLRLFTLRPVSDSCYDRLAILAGAWTKQGPPSNQGGPPSNQGAAQGQPSKSQPAPSLSGNTYAQRLPAAGLTTRGPKPHHIQGGYWRVTFSKNKGWITAGNDAQIMIFSARVARGRLRVGGVRTCADQINPGEGIYKMRWLDARHFGLKPVRDSCYDRLAIMAGTWGKQGP